VNAIYHTSHHFLSQRAVLEIDNCILDINIKSIEEDPNRKWITTWNDYLMISSISLGGYIKTKRKQRINTMKKRKWHRDYHQIGKRLPRQRIKHLFRQSRPFNQVNKFQFRIY
jgi:hypothetical protein